MCLCRLEEYEELIKENEVSIQQLLNDSQGKLHTTLVGCKQSYDRMQHMHMHMHVRVVVSAVIVLSIAVQFNFRPWITVLWDSM